MESRLRNTFSKKERICGKKDISRLLSEGRFGNSGCLRYCFIRNNGAGCDRIMVSVPKKLFKRAIRRNLLKRRIRESYRLNKKDLATGTPVDIMFVYGSREISGFNEICSSVRQAISQINRAGSK